MQMSLMLDVVPTLIFGVKSFSCALSFISEFKYSNTIVAFDYIPLLLFFSVVLLPSTERCLNVRNICFTLKLTPVA